MRALLYLSGLLPKRTSGKPRKPVTERFWSHVTKGRELECWPWKAGTHVLPYFQLGGRALSSVPAQRVAWYLTYGPIPLGSQVIRTCHNRRCMNPSHLALRPHGRRPSPFSHRLAVPTVAPQDSGNLPALGIIETL